MQVPLMDLKAEYLDLRVEMLEAIDEALTSMQLFLGPNVQALESEFAEFCGVKHAIGCGSGTDACFFALKAAGVGPGDEVITVSWTFIATIAAIVHTGATPVLVDIEPRHFSMDPEQVRAAITPRTKAIMPVHIYGYPADMGPLREIAEEHGLVILEDACQAHGASWNGQKTGTLGLIGAFSCYMSKNLGGYGEAGLLTTNDDAVADQLRLLRNHGYAGKYEHALLGYNSRLDEIQAAILRIKLDRLPASMAIRREQAAMYHQLLADTPLTLPQEDPGFEHCWYMFNTRAPRRDELAAFLADRCIATAQHYVHPAHHQPACAPYGLNELNLPETDKASQEILILPCHPYLSEAQIRFVAESVKEFYG
ncbi:MAG TPA: DegT/DnrJ/EryC1/StrS family aminotransferase [Armatimonadota bacterium]